MNTTILASYNVTWDFPSKTPSDSMPLGNGDIGLNLWVEENGDLLFYISKSDSWDDNGRLVKIGRVRIRLSPAPPCNAESFVQTLSLADATVIINFGKNTAAATVRVWVDANHPVINVEVNSVKPVAVSAAIELWRTGPQVLPTIETSDVMNSISDKPQGPTVVEPDTVLKAQAGRIGWLHHNVKSVGPAMTADIQGLHEFPRQDPLLHRAFGAVIMAEHGQCLDDLHLLSPEAGRHRIRVHVLTKHPATPCQWQDSMDQAIAKTGRMKSSQRRKAHESWWKAFWERSWIHVTPAEQPARPAQIPSASLPVTTGRDGGDAFTVSRAYALQRYINACAGRGRYPIKFNGSIFTVAHPGKPGDADYRRWGPGYWWQNTRLPYLGMCTSGDFDLLTPLFRMYARELMPLFRYRTRVHTGHTGAYIPECIYFWGDIFSETYGWTPCAQRADKLQESGWHKWEWVSGLELVFLMLDCYEHTLDRLFLQNMVLPAAHEILTFFDQQYQTDAAGKLVMHPAQALETWWDCTNPMPEVAGLHAVTTRLLSLPKTKTTIQQRAFWKALKQKLPDLPTRDINGQKALAAADRYAVNRNSENPELYAVSPFRLMAVGHSDIKAGITALRARAPRDTGSSGWRQDDIFMACLGLAEEARANIAHRAANHPESRFPAFWGPNFDWIPDQDHGGVLVKALQAMVMQTDGRKIYLLPAWPKDWDVDFKLHAPCRTIIRGIVRKGKLENLAVTPSSRRRDIIILPAQRDALR